MYIYVYYNHSDMVPRASPRLSACVRNTTEQLRREGFIEDARDENIWKNFLVSTMIGVFSARKPDDGDFMTASIEVRWEDMTAASTCRFVLRWESGTWTGPQPLPRGINGFQIKLVRRGVVMMVRFGVSADPIKCFGRELWEDPGELRVGDSGEFLDLTELSEYAGAMTKCNRCGKDDVELLLCQKCKMAVYCSRQCQEIDKSKHEQLCVEK
jgi:hypothetical protein